MSKPFSYFQHDSQSRNDPKIKKLVRHFEKVGGSPEHGLAAESRFFRLLEILTTTRGYALEVSEVLYDVLQEELRFDSTESTHGFIMWLIKEGSLLTTDGQLIWNARHREYFTGIAETKRAAANARWGDVPPPDPKMQPHAPDMHRNAGGMHALFLSLLSVNTKEDRRKILKENNVNQHEWETIRRLSQRYSLETITFNAQKVAAYLNSKRLTHEPFATLEKFMLDDDAAGKLQKPPSGAAKRPEHRVVRAEKDKSEPFRLSGQVSNLLKLKEVPNA